EDLSMVPPHHLANARARGSQIDDACSLIMEGKFTSIHDELLSDEARPSVEAYREFWASCDPLGVLQVQTPLYSRELDFCCTPDWYDLQSVNDIKATSKESRTWGLQTAAQLLAHGYLIGERRIIWLRPLWRKKEKIIRLETHSGITMNPRIFSALDFDV